MDEFYFSCMVCINSLIRNKHTGNNCALVLELTEAVVGHELEFSHEQIKVDFNYFIDRLHETFEQEYSEQTDTVQNYLTKKIENFLKDKYRLMDYQPMTLLEGGWQVIDGPWIWHWIHIVSLHIDINGGVDEKVFFINMVEDLIACNICKHHYIKNKPILISGLGHFSLTDLFLMLHTHTKIDYGETVLTLNIKDINTVYKKQFQQNYINLN